MLTITEPKQGRSAERHRRIFSFFVIVRRDRLCSSFLLGVDSPHNRLLEKIPSAWEERPPHSTKRKQKNIFHEIYSPCSRKGTLNFVDKNRLVLGLFLSLGAGPPLFTITTVLSDTLVCHKLNEIGRLALQQSAQSF